MTEKTETKSYKNWLTSKMNFSIFFKNPVNLKQTDKVVNTKLFSITKQTNWILHAELTLRVLSGGVADISELLCDTHKSIYLMH